jgi:hypothetical protein
MSWRSGSLSESRRLNWFASIDAELVELGDGARRGSAVPRVVLSVEVTGSPRDLEAQVRDAARLSYDEPPSTSRSIPAPGYVGGVDVTSALAGEDEACFGPVGAGPHTLFELALAVDLEHGLAELGKADGSPLPCLGAFFVDLDASRRIYELALDPEQGPPFRIGREVVPTQPQKLACPQARWRANDVEGEEPLSGRGAHELPDLLGAQDLEFRLYLLGRIGVPYRVEGYETPARRLVRENAATDSRSRCAQLILR